MRAIKLVSAFCLVVAAQWAHAAPDVVRLGNLKFAHYGAVSYMKEIAPKYNLKIEERVFPKGLDILPAIVAGDIDVAASAMDAAIAGRAAGAPVLVVAGFAKGGARIVGRADEHIRTMEQLKGKTVGVARGGAQELLLYAELAKHHMTWSDQRGKADVRIVFMAFPDLNQALMQKQIDAMAQSEPYSTQAIHKGFGTEITKGYDTLLGEPVRTLVMTEKFYGRRDVALRFMKCFVEATNTFIKNPKLAQQYVKNNMFKGQLSDQDYIDSMDNAAFTYDVTVPLVQSNTDAMLKYGVGKMSRAPQAKTWVKLDLLHDAKKQMKVQ